MRPFYLGTTRGSNSTGSARGTAGRAFELGAVVLATLALSTCGPPDADSNDRSELSEFAEETLVSGRILENSTACEVDAVCYLRIQFSDTSIVAIYGTGERPAPTCEIPRGVSNDAFQVEPGELVDVVVSVCDPDVRYLRQLRRGDK